MTTFVLKVIACVTMLIDHTAVSLFDVSGLVPQTTETRLLYLVLRGIGRIAFPIFCFLIVQGAIHTRNKGRYLARIGFFALISEIPFNLALNGRLFEWNSAGANWLANTHQNVDFTLFFGLLTVILMQWSGRRKGGFRLLGYILSAIAGAGLGLLARFFHTDYGLGGVLQIAMMGILVLPLDELRPGLSNSPMFRAILSAAAILVCSVVLRSDFELIALLSVPFIALYNEKPGPKTRLTKWGGYLFYPVHLTVLAWIFTVPGLIGA